jgi:hypothetical protein
LNDGSADKRSPFSHNFLREGQAKRHRFGMDAFNAAPDWIKKYIRGHRLAENGEWEPHALDQLNNELKFEYLSFLGIYRKISGMYLPVWQAFDWIKRQPHPDALTSNLVRAGLQQAWGDVPAKTGRTYTNAALKVRSCERHFMQRWLLGRIQQLQHPNKVVAAATMVLGAGFGTEALSEYKDAVTAKGVVELLDSSAIEAYKPVPASSRRRQAASGDPAPTVSVCKYPFTHTPIQIID